jgi:hypothetical protein
MMPHRALLSLYRARSEARTVQKAPTMVSASARRAHLQQIELEILAAERRYGRQVLRFRRCAVCSLLHSADSAGCFGHGYRIYELYSLWSVDLIFVTDD